MNIVAFDFETFKMTPKTGPTPPPVCISYAMEGREGVFAHCDKPFYPFIERLVDPEQDFKVVAHNNAYDVLVLIKDRPDLIINVFKSMEKGRFVCTMIREKLLNLTTLGWIEAGEAESGQFINRQYDLATCIKDRFKVDISDDKKDPAAWRLRYGELHGIPAKEYPEKAYDYALMDSVWAYKLYWDQEERRQHVINTQGFDPFDFEGRCQKKLGIQYDEFKSMIAVDAGLVSLQGLRVNKEAKAEVDKELDEELAPEKLNLLFEHNILTRAMPPQPFSNGALDHDESCVNYQTKVPKKKRPYCGCPPKMKAATPEKLNKKVLQKYAIELFIEGKIPKLVWSPKCRKGKDQTKEGATFALLAKRLKGQELHDLLRGNPQFVSVAKEFFAELEGLDLDPVLAQFVHRNNLQKIKTSALPAICEEDGITPAEFVYPMFDVLKTTSRFSSKASKHYPSMNVQQVDARMRKLIIPRKDHWFYSIDYASLEFISAASNMLALGIDSMYAKLINEGGDCHGFLAANLAYEMDPYGVMKSKCDEAGLETTDYYGIYQLFCTLKKDKKLVAEGQLDKNGKPYQYYKYWRTFSKPNGLGCVGGMGWNTLMVTAKTQYGLHLTEEEAKRAKEITLTVLPEIAMYLEHIKRDNIDFKHTKYRKKVDLEERVDEHGETYIEEVEKTYKDTRYVYTTPLGLRRPNCNFTQVANGEALQSPSTEGVQVAIHLIVKETFCNPNSVLYGNHFLTGIIHDEIVGDVKANPDIADPVMRRLMKLLNVGLENVCEGVQSAADPAMMLIWSKEAEEEINEKGQYIPYDLEEE
ncbi:MAG: hypothetical protein HRU26_09005 [Psychroserpens sp.]|nr:hypothetical protein [Psychroserpens sp.]